MESCAAQSPPGCTPWPLAKEIQDIDVQLPWLPNWVADVKTVMLGLLRQAARKRRQFIFIAWPNERQTFLNVMLFTPATSRLSSCPEVKRKRSNPFELKPANLKLSHI